MPPPDLLLQPLHLLPDPLPVPILAQSRGGPASFSVRIRPPGSKSLTNRALLLAALASGTSTLRGPLLGADDTERMIAALETLGARIERTDNALQVHGTSARWQTTTETTLHLENAGTAVRFLAAAAILSPAPIIIDGNARMRQRPIGELADALEQLGIRIDYLNSPDCPPLRITPPSPPAQLPSAARLEIGRTASSQFISALLLIAPFLPGGLTLTLDEITSRSYVQMTLGLMDAIGIGIRTSEDLRIIRISPLPQQTLPPFDYSIEPDASSATYFWAAAAICPGSTARIRGLDNRSLQADTAFPELLARMGATILRDDHSHEDEVPWIGIRGPARLDPIMADMSQMPDAALTLAAVACFAQGRSILRGLRTLRVKESDRLAALQAELSKTGAKVEVGLLGDKDTLTIEPPPQGLDLSRDCPPITFHTYNDHRMAMALSLIALKRPHTQIQNPACVHKTYPTFWQDLASLY